MTQSRLSVRIRAVMYNADGKAEELFDSAFNINQDELRKEAAMIPEELRIKILKYLDSLNL